MTENTGIQRLPAEELYRRELEILQGADKEPRPTGWKLSPKAVLSYITGGKVKNENITPKYIGNRRAVEICIATLLTDRALLLLGEPGTAKSWLSEHLAASIHGDSTKVIQGTAGTTEEQIKYSWNYATLIAEGPSLKALIKSPVYRAMEKGEIVRFEEISRCASEVQDALISILSEKRISIPELNLDLPSKKGFSLIATANTRDKGVNDMSSALKRRFNIVILSTPVDIDTEIDIVQKRVRELSSDLELRSEIPETEAVKKVVTIFRELRDGMTLDSKEKVKTPSGVLSTAEAISLLANSMALAASFGSGKVQESEIASGLHGSIIKDDEKDKNVWEEYLENIMKKRGSDWRKLFQACKELNS
jgi:MoxR-like ATPase